MGLKSDITQSIAEAFATDLKDAVKPFTGKRVVTADGEYDFINNDFVNTDKKYVTYSGKGVFSSYKAFEVDNETILVTDLKLIFLQGNLKPQNDDIINNEYQVVSVSKDPADVIWIIQLRKA